MGTSNKTARVKMIISLIASCFCMVIALVDILWNGYWQCIGRMWRKVAVNVWNCGGGMENIDWLLV